MENCKNLNHNKMNITVMFCSDCGEVVNRSAQSRACGEMTHAKKRKDRDKFCTDCGKKLLS